MSTDAHPDWLAALYRDHWPNLVRYLERRHNPGDDVEDIAQRAVLALWRRRRHMAGKPMVVVLWNLYRAARDVPRVKSPRGKPGRNGRHPRTDWARREASAAWEFLAVEPADPVAEWVPDDLDATDRRVLLLMTEGRMTPGEVGAEFGRTKSWANVAFGRAVARVAKTRAAQLTAG
jgi:DNA-directed RNA polymerase specialized sigma24 family protein